MRSEAGFTLIELMIVVAIIGILASIAIPAYQDFMVRSKVSETLAQMAQCKTTASEFYQSHNGWNTMSTGTNISTLGLCDTIATNHTLSMNINNVGMVTAAIQYLGGTTASGDTITMTPLDTARAAVVAGGTDVASWRCGSLADGTTLLAKYRPGSCQG